ncbi:hypothetical protein, partial [Rhodococcus sp. (in: high G+C Gram-positive bacteria)]
SHARSIRGFAGTVSIGVAWVDRAMPGME